MTRSLAIVLAIVAVASATSGATLDAGPLVFTGTVRRVSVTSADQNYVDLDVVVDLSLANSGSSLLILLRPRERPLAEIYWLGSISLSLSQQLAERGDNQSTIWTLGTRPASNTGSVFRQVSTHLDKPVPPSDLTVIVSPGAKVDWQTVVHLRFNTHANQNSHSAADLDWGVIGKIPTPLWMRLTYIVWSPNLIRASSNLPMKLQKRWARFGSLVVRPEMTTSPIELRLSDAQGNTSRNRTQLTIAAERAHLGLIGYPDVGGARPLNLVVGRFSYR